MWRTFVLVSALLVLVSAPVDAKKTQPRRARSGVAETLQPATPFDCDTPRASAWFGSASRCLDELCRGGNVTNASVIGGDGRMRANPCARGRDDRR
jgi:hypothetical protein